MELNEFKYKEEICLLKNQSTTSPEMPISKNALNS